MFSQDIEENVQSINVKPQNFQVNDQIMENSVIKDYPEYEILAVREDIKKLNEIIKPYWGENVPFLGCMLYMGRLEMFRMNIRRSPLDKEILNARGGCRAVILGRFRIVLMLITPYYTAYTYRVAIRRTEEKLNNAYYDQANKQMS